MSNSAVIGEMQARVMELSENSALILSDDDREFILGLKILIEMEERLDEHFAPRVAKIYQQTSQNAFGF